MIRAFILLFGSTALMFGASSSDGTLSSDPNAIVAQVDGVSLTYAQLENKRSEALFHARNIFYESEKKALEDYIEEYLLERQAQKENTTVAKLLEQHVNGTIEKDPEDAALRIYYEGLDTKEPFEAVRGKILDHIRELRIAKAKNAYMESLRNQAKITIDVQAPRMAISLKDQPVRGPADAPVQVIEYADYECPSCRQLDTVLRGLLPTQPQVRLIYKDFPLTQIHPWAMTAAIAGRCVYRQDPTAFWKFHDLLFDNHAIISPENAYQKMQDYATESGLDAATLKTCMSDPQTQEEVKRSMAEGEALHITNTPTIFVNGRRLIGPDAATLQQFIQYDLSH